MNLLHKDMLGKMIQKGDYALWGSPRQGYYMRLVKIESFTNKQAWFTVMETGVRKRGFPHHLAVITAQLQDNRTNGTGVEFDIPVEGIDYASRGMKPGQSASSWLMANGVSKEELGHGFS